MTSESDNTQRNGEKLISELLSTPERFSRYNELLNLFFNGLSIGLLGKLLQHPSDRVISGSLFIAEELGKAATPLVNDIIAHFRNKNPRIRISAFDALGGCISSGNESKFAHVALAIQDADNHCRKIAMLWMIRAPDSWLEAALSTIEHSESNTEILRLLRMLRGESATDPTQIESWLHDQTPLVRRIGVIAAGRIADRHPNLLELASKSEDTDVRDCASAQMHFRALRRM